MSEEPGEVADLEQILPLRLPREGERVLAERRRAYIIGGLVLEWMLETVLVRPRLEGEPDAHEHLVDIDDERCRTWALQTLHDHRLNPSTHVVRVGLTDRCDVPEGEWDTHPLSPDSMPDPDPVSEALDLVEEAQTAAQRAESQRVRAAVAAWRAAVAEEAEPGAFNTPYQKGFFTDLAFRLRIAAATARSLVHTASDLEQATPEVWDLFVRGRTTWRALQAVHAAMDGLDVRHHAEFDRKAARKILEVTPTGLPDALRRLRERLQATTADDRHERAAARRHVRVEAGADGMAWLHAYLPAVDALSLDHQLAKAAIAAAGREGETRTVGQLRADVLRDGIRDVLRRAADSTDLLVPGRRGVEPRVSILIPAMTALDHSSVPATLHGYGPIGIRTALRLAGTATAWVRVLTDPLDGAVLGLGRRRYKPNRAMRHLLHLLDGGARGPGGPRPPDQTEIDHTRSFNQDDEQGRTEIDNLVLLSHEDHAVKTEHGGDYDLMLDRTLLWHTSTGTTVVTRPHDPVEPTPVPPDLIDPEDCPF